MISLLLAAFFLSPAANDGLKPVVLSGDMRADWTNHAMSAEACVVDEMPTANILDQWKHLGVKVLKRVRFDPECSAEYFRRKVGFLAVHEGADGVWLEDEEKYPETWKQALAAAKVDVAMALYCKRRAEEALGWKTKDNKVWIEGRRVLWLLKFMNFDTENLDTLRLEFLCYAKRMDQLLGKPMSETPPVAAKPIEPDRAPFVPLAGRDVRNVAVSLDKKDETALSDGFSFRCDDKGFGFRISSKTGAKDVWPGGRGSLRLYIADGKGGQLPYEFRIDLSQEAAATAPASAYGLWHLRERWGKGTRHLYEDNTTWRLKPIPRGTYSSRYPRLEPRFDFKWNDEGGWTLKLDFSWLSVYGLWPSSRNGGSDKWYVSLDALAGIPAAACRLDWARGREQNYRKLALGVSCFEITSRYEDQLVRSRDIYRLWHEDRLYGFAKTATPTFQRYDPESDKVFWERIVEPMVEANASLAEITHAGRNEKGDLVSAKLDKESEAVKVKVCRSLGGLFDFAERVSAARRDYILLRYDGKIPPEPPKRKPAEGAAALTAPDADNDDEALSLDDKEF